MWNLLIPVLSIAFEILSVDASLLFRLEIYVQVIGKGNNPGHSKWETIIFVLIRRVLRCIIFFSFLSSQR
jgi:hypothetical protein